MKIKIIKFAKNLISPNRSHYNDAGADCFSPSNFKLETHQVLMVPLGFGVEVPDGYMAVIKPRSSMNAKGIITQIGTIDSGYRGEVKAVFINATDNEYEFFTNDKIKYNHAIWHLFVLLGSAFHFIAVISLLYLRK